MQDPQDSVLLHGGDEPDMRPQHVRWWKLAVDLQPNATGLDEQGQRVDFTSVSVKVRCAVLAATCFAVMC